MTEQPPEAVVYGSYNARSTPARAVAKNFVAPPQFWDIIPLSNTIVTGPRGSGKTTLLKMLTTPALEAWDGPRADEARTLANYTGVFVPADRSWAGQVRTYERALDDALHTDLGRATFVLHVMRALVSAAWYRTAAAEGTRHLGVTMDVADEERIARAISPQWALPGLVGSFEAVRDALSDEISNLGRLARRANRSPAAATQLAEHPALDLDVIDAAVPFIDRFNSAADDEGHVWTLLIDEIEFLPYGVRESMVEALRGSDPRIMQKISYAPYTEVLREEILDAGGWVGHDYQRVDLTFGEKEGGFDFSRGLVAAELLRRDVDRTPEELLGAGFFEMPAGKEAYGPKSRNAKAIQRLATKDRSFAAWCGSHGVDPDSPAAITGNRRAATLRKAMPVILLRDAYLRQGRDGVAGRSRRISAPIYTGAEGVYAICENNPRLLKALVQRLIDRRDEHGDLSLGQQAKVIAQACMEYRLHLRAVELHRDESVPDDYLPRQLVDRIGTHFREGVLGERFDPEPPLSFIAPGSSSTVEGGINQPLNQVIRALINYGAIVALGRPEERRYGLSHMFAPVFHLPLRRGRELQLSNLLSNQAIDLSQMTIDDEEMNGDEGDDA